MRRTFLWVVLIILLAFPAVAQQALGPAISGNNLHLGGPTIGTAYGIPVHDAQGTLSSEMVIPQGGTTPQPLSSLAAAATNAVPKVGASIASPGVANNAMTGPLASFPVPYGNSIMQTAASFGLGGYNGCAMGGAQNGQGAGGLGAYNTVDGVTVCESAESAPDLFDAPGTFDATHFYPTTPIPAGNLAKLIVGVPGVRAGTWIVVNSGDDQYASWITNYAPDGSSVTVIGWWKLGTAGYQAPTGTLTAYFGVDTKLWARNTIIQLGSPTGANVFASHGIGDELDAVNYLSDTADIDGFVSVQLGNHVNLGADERSGDAFQARGIWGRAYLAESGQDAAFVYDPTLQAGVSTAATGAFVTRQVTGTAFGAQPGGMGAPLVYSVSAVDGSVYSQGSLTLAGVMTDYVFPSPVLSLTGTGGRYDANNLATITIAAPASGGTQATAAPATYGMGNDTVAAGGSGYTNGDTCALVGGTLASGSAATVMVTVSGGAVTAVTGATPGSYSALPPTPTSISCADGGSGATLGTQFFLSAAAVTNGGMYASTPAVTVTGGVGGANATLTSSMTVGFNVASDGSAHVGSSGTKLTSSGLVLHAGNAATLDFLASNTAPAGSQGYNMRLLNQSNGALELWGINGGTNVKLGQWTSAGANYFTVVGAAS